MFTRAKKILASELMYALEMDEDEVDQHLHSILIEQHGAGPATIAVATD
jgi:CarD family transcriptional regulator